MKNYAGMDDKDDEIQAELEQAGIKVYREAWLKDRDREVKTSVIGTLHGWTFDRAWYYWVAEGPGIPPTYANKLHKKHGKEVRVDGHCGCPSPFQWNKGFAVGFYHVDTQEGLNALAETIRTVVDDACRLNTEGQHT